MSGRTAISILSLLAWAGMCVSAGAQPAQAQQDAIRSNCRSDFLSLCSGVPRGGREAFECLAKNQPRLSGACRAAVSAVAPVPAAIPQQKPNPLRHRQPRRQNRLPLLLLPPHLRLPHPRRKSRPAKPPLRKPPQRPRDPARPCQARPPLRLPRRTSPSSERRRSSGASASPISGCCAKAWRSARGAPSDASPTTGRRYRRLAGRQWPIHRTRRRRPPYSRAARIRSAASDRRPRQASRRRA